MITKIKERHLDESLRAKLNSAVDSTTVFNEDGSITTTYADGTSQHTVFNEDGSITTTKNGVVETTVFNDDGSITTTFTEEASA